MSTKLPVFEPSSERVADAFSADGMVDYMSYFDTYRVDKIVPNILVYAGQWDNRDGPVTIEPWIT
jgi:hypothetical protein